MYKNPANIALRSAIDKAKKAQVPSHVIDNAIKNQNERKKVENSKNASLPKNQYAVSSKLADCNETKINPQNCEIFIVEGE